MTDHLEPFRQLARAIRFAPPLGQHERLNKLVHQPSPVPSAQINSTAQVTRPSLVAPDRGPTPDPSEHAAAVVHAAVSKATVLPVINNFQENISDRIERLGSSKQARLPIVMPKIPAPDPNWIPPAPPPISQHLVTETPAAIATAPAPTTSEVKSDVPQAETPVDLKRISTPVEETEEIDRQVTEPSNLDQTHSPIEETEKVVSESTESVNLEQVATDSADIEAVVPETVEQVDLSQTHPPIEETENIVSATTSVELPANNETVEAELNDKETVTQNTETLEIEDISSTEAENSVKLNESATSEEQQVTISQPEKELPEPTKTSSKGKVKVTCPECKSREVRKNGRQKNKQKYLCKDCGRQFVWSESVEEQVNEKIESIAEPKPTENSLPSKLIEEPKPSENTLPSKSIEETKPSENSLASETPEKPKPTESPEEIQPSEPKEKTKASENLSPNKSKVSKTNSKQAKGFGRSKKK